MAVAQAELIEVEQEQSVRLVFGDIVRALEYSTPLLPVDEAAHLRQVLLCALAPCLDSCTKATTSAELNQKARVFVKDRAALFTIENVTVDNGSVRLRVALNSPILGRRGFPVEVSKDNIYAVLEAALPSW